MGGEEETLIPQTRSLSRLSTRLSLVSGDQLYFLPLNRRSDIVFEDVEEALHIPHVHHTFDEISPPVKPAPIVVAPPLGEAVTPARPVRPVIPAVAPPFIAPMVPKAPVVAPRPPPIAPVAPVIPVIAAAPARPPKAAAAPAREAKFKREENGLMIVPLEEVGVGKHPIEVLIEVGSKSRQYASTRHV